MCGIEILGVLSMAEKRFMAKDQFGNTYHDIGPHPRKGLMEVLGYRSAKRMFRDSTEGCVQVGWVVGPHWCTVFEVRPMRQPA